MRTGPKYWGPIARTERQIEIGKQGVPEPVNFSRTTEGKRSKSVLPSRDGEVAGGTHLGSTLTLLPALVPQEGEATLLSSNTLLLLE